MILLLAEGLRGRGMDVSLLVLGRPAPRRSKPERGAPRADPSRGSARHGLPVALARAGIKLVNAHYSTFGAAIAAEMGIPFVQVVHNAYVWLDDRAIAQIPPGRSAHDGLSLRLGPGGALCRLRDGPVGLQDGRHPQRHRWQPARRGAVRSAGHGSGRSWASPRDDYVFLNVASIHATKAQKVLVQAFARVASTHPHARLVIVGPAS